MVCFVRLRDNPLEQSYAVPRKNIAPLVAAGLVTGAGSLLSSLIGGSLSASATKDTNKTNLRIAQETNAMNERLFNQNLVWQEDMWNKTNAYNSPKNQVDMLLKAGINPASVMGNGSFSDASLPSAPAAPQMQGATMQAPDYSFIGQSIDSGINAFFKSQIDSNNVMKGAADAQIANVQAEFDAISMMDRASKIANDASKSAHERETARLEMDFLSKSFDERVMQTSQLTKIQEQQFNEIVGRIEIQNLEKEAMRIANKYAPQLNEAQLRQLKAACADLFASAKAHNAEALESGARKLLVDMQKEGVRLDNEQKDSIMDALIDAAESRADEAFWNSQDAKKRVVSGRAMQFFGQNSWDTPASDRRTRKETIENKRPDRRHVRDYSKRRTGGVR